MTAICLYVTSCSVHSHRHEVFHISLLLLRTHNMGSSLFWDITQRRVVILSRNVGTELPLYAA
jgi:hypothetical protein